MSSGFYLCALMLKTIFMFVWKSVEGRYLLIMVKCLLRIYGSKPYNQEITEVVRTLCSWNSFALIWMVCHALPEKENLANHQFLMSYMR